MSTRTALIVVDVQNDFTEDGALPVNGGNAVAANITNYLADHADDYDMLIATRDWHTNRTVDHFAPEGTDPNFVNLWPVHCMAGTDGAEYHPAFKPTVALHPFTEILKGQNTAAYSGFEGTLMTNSLASLASILVVNEITDVHVCGLATDYCVKDTATDALAWQSVREGDSGRVIVLEDLAAPVAPETGEAAINAMRDAGIEIATTETVLVP